MKNELLEFALDSCYQAAEEFIAKQPNRREAKKQLRLRGISVVKEFRDTNRLEHLMQYGRIEALLHTIENLTAYKTGSVNDFVKPSREPSNRAYIHMIKYMVSPGQVANQLLIPVADALLQFTDVNPKGAKTGIGESDYETWWPWALAMSVNGGNEAISFFEEEILGIGDECFDPNEKKDYNFHWSAAYQEILLEALYLARTLSPNDITAKKHALTKAQQCKSLHVKNLSQILLSKPLVRSEWHSVAEHKFLLFYRQERANQPNGDYTHAVLIDKTPLLNSVSTK